MVTINDFLNRFINYSETTQGAFNRNLVQPYFQKKKIKDIDKASCINSEIEVYDFDTCKTIVDNEKKLNSPKSCDALKIDAEAGKIYFIEFKRWEDFIRRRLPEEAENKKAIIQTQIKKFQLDIKIHDSLLVLNCIAYDRDFRLTRDEKRIYLSLPKEVVILVDINNQEATAAEKLAVSFNMSSLFNSKPELIIEQCLEAELRSIPSSALSNVERFTLKNCETIENYFSTTEI